jgi:3-isopropylmalate dehydrogenase
MYRLAVIPGDGVGPEVVDEGLRVLRRIEELEGIQFDIVTYPFGAEHYLKSGELMPDSVFTEFRDMSAILLGAIGDPRVGIGVLERAIIGGVRWTLDLYVNLRPIKLYSEELTPIKNKVPKDIDMVFVRENTEGLYMGIGGHLKKGTPDEVAIQEMVMTRKGVERAVRYAFEPGDLEPHLRGSRRVISRHQPGPCLHRCRVYVDGKEPGMVRRRRCRQYDG